MCARVSKGGELTDTSAPVRLRTCDELTGSENLLYFFHARFVVIRIFFIKATA